ncbi:MAG: NifB/NifX family molybdenum-iron cluster-binding protein [Thermodesulfobacteriota bacterium]
MRIAVVSSDSRRVDQRFSRANRFLIFEAGGNGGLHLVDERPSEPLPQEFFDQEMFDWVADIIGDCDRVYMARIRERPARALRRRGIRPVVFQGPIGAITV